MTSTTRFKIATLGCTSSLLSLRNLELSGWLVPSCSCCLFKMYAFTASQWFNDFSCRESIWLQRRKSRNPIVNFSPVRWKRDTDHTKSCFDRPISSFYWKPSSWCYVSAIINSIKKVVFRKWKFYFFATRLAWISYESQLFFKGRPRSKFKFKILETW